MKDKKESSGDLLQGTLDLLILKALAKGSMHGYGVAEWIHESSQDVLRVEEGALYPALHRLELRRKRLAEETEYWRRMSGAVARVLQTA